MSYAHFQDCDDDETLYDIHDANKNLRYKVLYILRKGSNYNLYKLKENDNLYDIKPSFLGDRNKTLNTICRYPTDIEYGCKLVMSAKKKLGKSEYHFSVLNKYQKLMKSDIYLKRWMNSWVLRDKHFDYLGIILNDNKFIDNKSAPNKTTILMPKIYDHNVKISKLSRACKGTNIVNDYIQGINNHELFIYYNKKAIWKSSLDVWTLTFLINTGGIQSKKNTVMVSNDGENELSLIESLKVHKNIVAVVYKSPISIIHAFGFGLSKFH